MNRYLTTTAFVLCGATSAVSEVTYGNAFARYHNFDVDNAANVDAGTFGGTIEFVTGGFTFSGLATRVDIDGLDIDLIDLGAGYRFTPSIEAGIEYTNVDLAGLVDTDATAIYGLYAVGDTALGLSIVDFSDLDDTGFSLFASRDVTDNGRIGIDIIEIDSEILYSVYADYDTSAYDLRADLVSTDGLDALALRGAYGITDRIGITGALSTFDLAGLDGNAISVGVEYEVFNGLDAEVALGRIVFDGAEDIDQLTFGVQYEFGQRTSQRRSLGRVLSDATSNVIGLTDF